MTRSLQVRQGDLALEGGSFVLISGRNKLEQDLVHWLRTEFGSDRFHPTFGSTLEDFIGSVVGDENLALLESEVRRVLTNYQDLQLRRFLENRQRFTGEEILAEVDTVKVESSYDAVYVRIIVKNYKGQKFDISVGARS